MSIWQIVALAVAVIIIAGVFGAFAIGDLLDRMEQYRDDLEGVEIDGGWVHDAEPRA